MVTGRRFWYVILYSILIGITPINADDTAPYIYYYSYADNAFVIERADGTATQSFGSDILIDSPLAIIGGGWSPDGEWFVFGYRSANRPNGYIINPSSAIVHPIHMWRIGDMHWSPNSDYLLVSGNIDACDGYCSQETNWLINTQTGELLSWLDIRRGTQSPGTTPIEWDEGTVYFYRREEVFPNSHLTSTYQIMMNRYGEVSKYPISRDDYFAKFTPTDEQDNTRQISFISPDNRYAISATGELTDTTSQSQTQLPMPNFGFDGTVRIMDVHWHPSEAWVLISYTIWSGGVDAISIVKNDGSEYRALTTCGSSLACAGWLPDSVIMSP